MFSCPFLIKEVGKKILEDEICSFCNDNRKVIAIEDFFNELQEAIDADGSYRAIDIGSEVGYMFECKERKEIATDLCMEVGINNEKLITTVENLFNDDWMINKPYDHDYFDEMFQDAWKKFKKQIIHNSRFTFFMRRNKEIKEFSNVMDYLNKYYTANINQDLLLYRGRSFDQDSVENDPHRYGPPPLHKTKNYRMSPKGISYFYVSSDEDTVKNEIKNKKTKSIGCVEYRPMKNLKILDLSSEVKLPSPFDKEHREYRRGIIFLNEFIQEISKPVHDPEREHIGYLPTQVIAEYIKIRFFHKGIIGIKYKSSKTKGYNYVFFINKVNKHFNLISKRVSIL